MNVKKLNLKKCFLSLLLGLIIFSPSVFSQAPQAIPYQAIARDNTGTPLVNQSVSFQLSIRDITMMGTIVYQETHSATTNSLGLVTLSIGQGTPVLGTFSAVNWGTGSKFIQVELDPTGGTTYTDMGTTPLLSVPYALYAGSSNETDPQVSSTINNAIPKWNGTTMVDGIMTDNGNSINANVAAFNYLKVNSYGGGMRVSNSSNENATLRATNGGPYYQASLELENPKGFVYLQSPQYFQGDTSMLTASGDMWFRNGPAADVNMTIKKTGNVGIGTTTPTAKLDVNGDALIHGITVGRGNNSSVSNTAVGSGALMSVTANGTLNTAAGFQTLKSLTDGDYNTALGSYSQNNTTTGYANSSVGYQSLSLNTTGIYNTSIGGWSLRENQSGNYNTGLGYGALYYNTDGNYNTGVGYGAGGYGVAGLTNATAIGANSKVTGSNATAIGANSLATDSNTLVLGSIAGLNNATSGVKVGIGTASPAAMLDVKGNAVTSELLRISNDNNATPDSSFVILNNGNVGIGTLTPSSKLTSVKRNGLSAEFLSGVTNDWTAIAIGRTTGEIVYGICDAANNWLPGTAAGDGIIRINDATKKIHISPWGTTTSMTIADGKVGIGTTSPVEKLTVQTATSNYGFTHTDGTITVGSFVGGSSGGGWIGTKSNHNLNLFTNNNAATMTLTTAGNVGIGTTAPTAKLSVNGTANNTTGAWGVFSDARVKTVNSDFTDGLNIIKKIHPVKFTYNAEAPFKAEGEQIGIVAQELEQIAPYMVSQKEYGDMKDLRQVNNQAYVFLLINAVKEQQAQIEAQQKQIEALQQLIKK